MTFSPPNSLGFFIPENVTFAQDDKQFLLQLTTVYNQLAKASNAKDIGTYELTEILNGQKFFGANPQTKRSVYRKCFAFGAIAAGATLNIVHGIVGLVELTRLFGTCVTAVVDYRPIPYSSVTAANQGIEMLLAGANISVINGAASPNITSGIVVAEYLKN